jgi:hypothetical protein
MRDRKDDQFGVYLYGIIIGVVLGFLMGQYYA